MFSVIFQAWEEHYPVFSTVSTLQILHSYIFINKSLLQIYVLIIIERMFDEFKIERNDIDDYRTRKIKCP